MDFVPALSTEDGRHRDAGGRAAAFCLSVVVLIVVVFAVDVQVGLAGELVLGVVVWAALLAALLPLSTRDRLQTAVVVVVASLIEVVGSILWGVYAYRLHNLPLFVPPGHGLIYLAGRRLAEAPPFVARPRIFVAAVAAIAAGWGLAGITVLPRADASGALGTTVFLVFLLFGRTPTLYAGVYLVVALVELSGTAIGVWAWTGVVPGLHLSSGNPPSGAASGYVLFDIVAIAVSTRLLRPSRTRRAGDRVGALTP
jgi:hypothetical protein